MFEFKETGKKFAIPLGTVSWEERSFVVSTRQCFIPSKLVKELENTLNQYFKLIQKEIKNGIDLKKVGLSGLHQESYQKFTTIPQFVRIDAGTDGNEFKIYEVQPRPGGMGILKWFCDNLEISCQLTEKWREIYEKVSFLNLTISNPPYLKEFLFFIEGTKGRFIQEEFLGNGLNFKNVWLYPRGNFLRACPKYLKRLEGKWIVPPGYLYDAKAWMEKITPFLPLALRRFFLPSFLLTPEKKEEVKEWSSKRRADWVAKPSYGFGAADVENLKTFSNKKFLGSLPGWENKMVFQQKFSQKIFVPELDQRANWIVRLYFIGNPLKFAGGLWNARNSFRVHGAEDAVFGLCLET